MAEAVTAFYMIMARASHNMVLLHVMSTMKDMLVDNIERNFDMLALHESGEEAVYREVAQQRKVILAAIVARDPEAARQACNAHLALIEKTLLDINQRDSRVQRALRRLEI